MGGRIEPCGGSLTINNVHIGRIEGFSEIKRLPKHGFILASTQKRRVDILGARTTRMKIDSGISKRQQNIDYKTGNCIGWPHDRVGRKTAIKIALIEWGCPGIGANRRIIQSWEQYDPTPYISWRDFFYESAKDQLAFIFIAMASSREYNGRPISVIDADDGDWKDP
tara:strand:+ start:673 stop:1173 length:501 start_codon:yes stop_codon:yes gene_type:complete